jgi:hypothetical protein
MFAPLLVEAVFVTRAKGLNKKTISQNDKLEKFQGIGERKILLKLGSVVVVRNRERKKQN